MRNEKRRMRVQLEMLESRLLLTAAFSNADVEGTWAYASPVSDGTVMFDGSGNISGGSIFDVGSGNATPSGNYAIDGGGCVTINTGETQTGAMNSARDVISFSDTTQEHSLGILVNTRGQVFSNADLTGTWFLGLDGFNGDSDGFGTLTFDGSGHITGGSTTDSTGTHSVTGTYTISADGTVTIFPGGDVTSFAGTMNGSKDFAALNPTDFVTASANLDTVLVTMVKAKGSFSTADAAGTWQVGFEGGLGNVVLDGSGHITGGTITNGSDGPEAASGTYSLSSSGKFTLNITTTGGSVNKTVYTGQMNVGKSIISMSRITTDGDRLVMMIRPSDHAPTLTTVAAFGTAVDLNGFTITYGDLKAHSNAGDIDGDGISFVVTAVAPVTVGTVQLNGDPLLVGDVIGGNSTITFTGAAGTSGNVSAFSVEATDGSLNSAVPVGVVVKTVVQPKVGVMETHEASETNAGTTGKGVFTFTRTGGDINSPLTVLYNVSGNATIAGLGSANDYSLDDEAHDAVGEITFAAKASTVTLTLTPVDDAVAESTETCTITLGIIDATYGVTGNKAVATVTIADNEPVVGVTATKAKASETNDGISSGVGQFTFKRTGVSLPAMDVLYTVTGTANNGGGASDLATALTGTVHFDLGATTAVVNVVPVDDALAEPTETVVVTLMQDGGPSYNVNGTLSTAVVAIADNEPTVSVTATKASASETNNGTTTGVGQFTFKRTGTNLPAMDVLYNVTGTANNGGGASDLATALTGTVHFDLGATMAVVNVVPADDELVEPTETVVVMVHQNGLDGLGVPVSPSYFVDSAHSTATVLIADNEPTVNVSASPATTSEKAGSAPAKFVFTRTMGSLEAMDVTYTVGGNATNGGLGSDNVTPLTGTVHFDLGVTSVSVPVAATDDGAAEATEILSVTLTSDGSSPYRVGTKGTASVAITDYTVAPGSLADKSVVMKVKSGTAPLLSTAGGTYTLLFSSDGSHYVLQGGQGVNNSTGTYTYDRVSGAVADLVVNDSDGGALDITLTFTSATAATYSIVQEMGAGTQTGTATVVVAPAAAVAPGSVAGLSVAVAPTFASAPFDMKPAVIVFSNDTDDYVVVSPGSGTSGTWTYQKFSSNVGIVSHDDIDGGDLTTVLTFTSATSGTIVITDSTGGIKRGTFSIVPDHGVSLAPAALGGISLGVTASSFSAPFDKNGDIITFSQNSNNYLITGTGSDGFASTGTWSYQKFSNTVGVITQHDNGIGDMSTVITFTSASAGTYVINRDAGGFKSGSFSVVAAKGVVPASDAALIGVTYGLHATGGTPVNPGSSGNFLLTFDSSTTYFTSDPGTPLTHKADGNYTYEQYSTGVGVLTLTGDSVDGDGIFVFMSTSSTQGTYLLRFDNNGNPLFQKGGYVLLTV